MNQELLSRNLQRWATYCPAGAKLLLHHQSTGLKQQEESLDEAKKWFKTLDLYNITTLFIYGVGTGKVYKAAKDWLLEDSKREIVFLEDDIETIYQLLSAEIGKEFIFDNQAWLQYIEDPMQEQQDHISTLPFFLFIGDIQIACLPSYAISKPMQFASMSNKLQYMKNVKIWQLTEHIQLGRGFFKNFYRNFIDLPKSYLSDAMFNQFKGVPAIICGGGPSLDKNRDLLEKLKDKALIFAGGSAMNVLNETGFNPHFGVGIDPNWAQYTRLAMNQAFAVPYFYRCRMYSEALQSIQGDHIFIRGSAGYDISSWAEDKLDLKGERLNEGNNVVNFSLSIAHALGCNPIIFVGVDLAYTQLASYSKGVLGHPLYDYNMNLSTKSISEELLWKKDIYGNDTYTLWKWIAESVWYSDYAARNHDLKLINSTEGGIGFKGIPNMSLAEVAEKYLEKTYDFHTWIHGEIQNAKMSLQVTEQKIIEIFAELEKSLEKCEEYCRQLRHDFNEMIIKYNEKHEVHEDIFSGKIKENIEKLNQEDAYTYLLAQFNDSFMSFAGKSYDEILAEELNEKDQEQARIRKIFINKRRYEFLMSVCKYNRQQINTTIQEQAIRNAVSEMKATEKPMPKFFQRKEEKFKEPKEFFYPDGKIKSRLSTQNGLLDGPAVFYNPKGKILAHSQNILGKKEGECWLFYETGDTYSVQNFANDKWEGKQEFYYLNGLTKTTLNYRNGLLDGTVSLYHPNGKLYRELHFKNGKRDGQEKLWNMAGILEYEAEYKENMAVGACRAWYPNGKVAREVIYDKDSKPCSVRHWGPDGTLIPQETFIREDYFENISQQTTVLTESLTNLYDQLVKVSPMIPDDKSEKNTLGFNLKNEIEDIKMKMEKLQEIEKQMQLHENSNGKEGESIWKSPAARRMMGKQLEEATRKMAEDITTMQDALKLAVEIVGKDQKKPPNKKS